MPLKNVRLQRIWEEMRSSFWFIPGLMVVLAVALSLLTMRLDRNQSLPLRVLWGGGPEGAWELLTTVAGSMVTVAGVTFSITMVVLSQAATQFGTQVLNELINYQPDLEDIEERYQGVLRSRPHFSVNELEQAD